MEDHEPERGFLGGPSGPWVPNPIFQPLRDARQAALNSPRSEHLLDLDGNLRTLSPRPDLSSQRLAPPHRIYGNMRVLPPPGPDRPNTGYNIEVLHPMSSRSIFDPIPSNWPPFPRLGDFNGGQQPPAQPQSQSQLGSSNTSDPGTQAPSLASLFTMRTRDGLELMDQEDLRRIPVRGGNNTGPRRLPSHDRFDDSFQESHTAYSSDHDSYHDSLSDSSNTTHLLHRQIDTHINHNGTGVRPRQRRLHRRRHSPRPIITMPCSVCLEDFPEDDLLHLECACEYCKDCLNGAFRVGCASMTSFPPRCCGKPLRSMVWASYLDPDVLGRYNEIEAEFTTHRPLYCAQKRCSEFIPDQRHLDGQEAGRCPECHTVTCKLCIKGKEAHKQWDLCRRICPAEDKDETALYDLSMRQKWRQCPTCFTMVEKTDGCNHMDCVCGLDFCYTCGKRYDGEGACDCDGEWDGEGPPDDENNDEEEDWPDFRAAVDMLGRPTCLHWSTDAVGLDSPEACHGCLSLTQDLQSCTDCHVELCEMCLSNVQGLARINGEVDQDHPNEADQPRVNNAPRRLGFPRFFQRQRA
ncbi:uncharacterized protein A1O9_06233 [Exophiala aquamarina CBS 119918]|uniref:RING-type domain-containing protein n=1 Tax=Exophiala aquamarina CBS 119918 TaxID=1182545 RepID=A0A072PF00_9EURO|nr:uncharacterized protein A1O9_06233 [Exophiala aquamarina CBS 119918]KEF58307.1 hypothetical protein A1O9_06233 [Exophiala aquamarina CBS 119918]